MKKRSFLIVGGSNGIGLALALRLIEMKNKVYILDRQEPEVKDSRIQFIRMNLLHPDFRILDKYDDINGLIITAGFGRLTYFEDIAYPEIENSFRVNTLTVLELIKKYYNVINSADSFPCVVIGSIAGVITSPLYALYSSTKAAVFRFIESVNIELEDKNSVNRILNVAPGNIKGTKFHGGENDLSLTTDLADQIIQRMYNCDTLFIPDFDNIYKEVINRYSSEPEQFGRESLQYKLKNNTLNKQAQLRIGYLSGTFDLFHIGHLNLIRRASQYCDYLVVGVHISADRKNKTTYIPFEERVEIIRSISYVDEAFGCPEEDSSAYDTVKYNFLFVGTDYKGTERFSRYEKYFTDKDVQIIYLPYTQGTSSTILRSRIIEED